MWETPYKHQENRHCRRGIDRGVVLKLISALSVCALPSSGHWGIGCLSPTSNGSVLHRAAAHCCAFSANIGYPHMVRGSYCPPASISVKTWGWRSDSTLGTLLVVSRDGYRSPQRFVCVTPSLSVQPHAGLRHSHRLLRSSSEDMGCGQYLRQLPAEQSSFSISSPL